MIDLPWSLILWCCWSTNLNTSAGDVYLADSAAMLTRKEASIFRLSPRFTCFPPRATSTQVPLVQAKYTTDSTRMLTRRKASTPRLSSQCSCLPPRQHCIEVALRGKQVHLGCRISELALLLVQHQLKYPSSMSKYLDMDEGYLSRVSGVLGLDSGYLSWVCQVNIPSCSTCTRVFKSIPIGFF